MRRRGLSLLLVQPLFGALVAGCGARSSLLEEEAANNTNTPPAEEPPAARFDCSVSDSTRPMLASRLSSSVYYSYPDRSSKPVWSFDIPVDMYVSRSDVIARGDRVAAFAYIRPLGESEATPFIEVVVLDLSGSTTFYGRYDVDPPGWGADYRVAGNANHLFVFTLFEGDTGLGVVVSDEQTYTFEKRMGARSDPDASGRMVVWNEDSNSTADLHFFDTAEGTFTPSQYISTFPSEEIASSPGIVASGLLYLMRNPNRLVFEDASGRSELPVDIKLDSPGYATPGYVTSGGYLDFMLGGTNEANARYLMTHFATGLTRQFQLVLPPGLASPGDYWNPPPVDASGRLLISLFNEEIIQLHATEDGQSWEPLGQPTILGSQIVKINERGNTVIYQGAGNPVSNTSSSWVSQLIGPEGGEGVELLRQDVSAPDNPLYAEDEISDDGRCVAYFKNGTLNVVEVAGYGLSDLGLTTGGSSAEMAWIPLEE